MNLVLPEPEKQLLAKPKKCKAPSYKFVLYIIFIFIPLSFFYGCVPSKPSRGEIEILPSERLIKRIEINRRRIKTFQGSGTIIIETENFNNRANFRTTLTKPDSLLLDIIGPFGIELANALVTRNDFIFYDALRNTAYKGKVDSDILKTIFKINISFEEIFDAFVGSVNLSEKIYMEPDIYEIDDDKYVLTYIDSARNIKTEYKIDIKELGLTDYTIANLNDDPYLEAEYNDFEIFDGVAIPYQIKIVDSGKKESVNIFYKKIKINQNSIVINLRIPDDASIIKW